MTPRPKSVKKRRQTPKPRGFSITKHAAFPSPRYIVRHRGTVIASFYGFLAIHNAITLLAFTLTRDSNTVSSTVAELEAALAEAAWGRRRRLPRPTQFTQ